MKPGKRDRKHSILITRAELQELKRHTYIMAESFGLDNRIDRYQGKRPIGLYRWDLECLLDVIELVERGSLPPGRALDLGCGTGTNCIYLAHHGWEVVGGISPS